MAFRAWREFARLGQRDCLAVRFSQSKALHTYDEEAFDRGRVSVFVVNAHMLNAKYRERLDAYLSLHWPEVHIKDFLGDGTDGAVWSTERDTAIKVFSAWRGYENERFTYQELKKWGITQKIAGFWIPEMHGFDDELMIVEMDVMHRAPYIIDFAKVKFSEPDYSPETRRDNEERGRERFEENWPEVQRLMSALASYQIFYEDPTPYNIVFPDSTQA